MRIRGHLSAILAVEYDGLAGGVGGGTILPRFAVEERGQ
jgi:hypothetical protein